MSNIHNRNTTVIKKNNRANVVQTLLVAKESEALEKSVAEEISSSDEKQISVADFEKMVENAKNGGGRPSKTTEVDDDEDDEDEEDDE